ncbi:MAG: dethiobiotin synthase [Alphaproteobacteria bacterium]|nr:dethiobiotin synthase [Alphaproteobacteria bacterium]
MTRLFVTATGTGIGKTLATSLLVRQLRAQGETVAALKPVISGFTDETAAESDTAELLRALDRPMTHEAVAQISPWRFAAPLSPDMAAAREGRAVPFGDLISFCCEPRDADHVLIEGVGGAFVPLDGRHLVADWIAALGIPALLVCGSYLGTLSHTISTLEALRNRHVFLAGILISESETSPVPPEEIRDSLQRFCGPVPILNLPRLRHWSEAPDLTGLVAPAGRA